MEKEVIRIGRELSDIAHSLKQGLNCLVSERCPDLNGFQLRILGYIAFNTCNGKMVYQKNIENEFNIKGSSVTSVLNNMEKNGYIVRQSVPGDKRRKSIVLTEKARRLGEKNMRIIDNYETLLRKNISDEELLSLESLLNKVAKNLEDIRGNNK